MLRRSGWRFINVYRRSEFFLVEPTAPRLRACDIREIVQDLLGHGPKSARGMAEIIGATERRVRDAIEYLRQSGLEIVSERPLFRLAA